MDLKNKMFYLKRYGRLFFRHLTLKKLRNIFTLELELARRKDRVNGYPYLIAIDPGNICNFKCPLCPTGKEDGSRPKKIMSLDEFKKIIAPLQDYALQVILHNWGEPFLVPDLFRMIEYARKKKIETKLSSNLVLLTEEKAEELIACGLEYLTVSIDGLSQETYAQYRVGGDLNKVMENLKMLMRKKKQLRSRTPLIEWQFLVMRHNEDEMASCIRLAKEIGVDVVLFAPLVLNSTIFTGSYDKKLAGEWLPAHHPEYTPNYEVPFLSPGICSNLWRSTVINSDGGVSPCCALYDKSTDFGNMLESDFKSIWNNEAYVSARRLFSRQQALGVSRKNIICNICKVFKHG